MPIINSEIILCHVCFNLETMKVNQCHDIFKMTYDPGSYDIGTQSISCKNQNVFVVFTREEYAFRGAPRGNIQEIKSDIYYFQYFNDRTSDAVKIGKGFLPQVRFDSNGEVYVFYIDYSGNLVVKKKENDCWSDNQIILSQIDLLPEITFMKCLDVKFDNENNLHIVYPSKGSLIYEKRKLLEN